MLKWLALIAVVAGCTGDDSVSYLQRVDTGSTWHLTFGAPTPQAGSPGPCPTLAPIRIELPAQTCTSASGTAACSLMFVYDADGGSFGSSSVSSDFAADSGSLSCHGSDPEHDTTVSCYFEDPSSLTFCDYSGQLAEVD